MNLGLMNLKHNKVKQVREQRAWSQSHLAEVSGLSLRTIQRIEKEHKASQESVQALASVFQTTPEMFLTNFSATKNHRAIWRMTFTAALLAFCIAYFWTREATSDSLTLDIALSFIQLEEPMKSSFPEISEQIEKFEQKHTVDMSIILQEGEKTIVKLNERIEYELTPSIVENNQILITARIIDKEQAGEPVVATPKIITNNHVEAFMVVSDEDAGAVYKIGVTPHI